MENFDEPNVRIQDVMSVNPIIIKKDHSIREAAELMKESGVGSLLVLESDGALAGILTEMDIVVKLVAEGLNPDEVHVMDLMSHPVHTIEGTKDMRDAAKLMAKLGVRRLPVTKEGALVGMLTENDIIELSPALLDITREYARISCSKDLEDYDEREQLEIVGYCESCGIFSERLTMKNGQLLCPECIR